MDVSGQIRIPTYGPRGLSYPEDAAVVPMLEETVTEPPIRAPDTPTPSEIPERTNPGSPWRVEEPPEPPDIQIMELKHAVTAIRDRLGPAPIVLFAADAPSRSTTVRVLEADPEHFAEIEHEGLIVAIAAASELHPEFLDSVRELAEELGIHKLPVYVRSLE